MGDKIPEPRHLAECHRCGRTSYDMAIDEVGSEDMFVCLRGTGCRARLKL